MSPPARGRASRDGEKKIIIKKKNNLRWEQDLGRIFQGIHNGPDYKSDKKEMLPLKRQIEMLEGEQPLGAGAGGVKEGEEGGQNMTRTVLKYPRDLWSQG